MHPPQVVALGGAPTARPRGRRIPENATPTGQARHVLLEQRPVDDALATGGPGAALAAVRLIRVLGRGAWRVWGALVTVRDVDAETTVTTRALVARTGLSIHSVKRALARLREAGLVEDVGWMIRHVPCHRCGGDPVHEHEVFVRVVRGQVREGPHGGLIVRVPRAVEAWTFVAPAHGGKRPGAGRPRLQEEAPMKRPKPTRQALDAAAPLVLPRPALNVDAVLLDVVGESARLATFEPSAVGGVVLAGPARLAEHPARELIAVPPYPGTNVVPPAVVPEPPLLAGDASDDVLFRTCVDAYRTVHEHDVGSSWFRPSRVVEKDRESVLRGARMLRANGIRPLRWVQWSFGVWREVAKKSTPPFLRWVFLGSRVEEHAGWFEAAWGSYRSGRVVLGTTHRALLERHGRMTSAIRRGTRPADAIATFFPGDLYDRMVEAARIEAVELQRDLTRRVHAGELVD